MKHSVRSHCAGSDSVPAHIQVEIAQAIGQVEIKIRPKAATKFATPFYQLEIQRLDRQGPVAKGSDITITSMRDEVGLCLQTGNMARMYADLIKLQTLYLDNAIKSAVIIVRRARRPLAWQQHRASEAIGARARNLQEGLSRPDPRFRAGMTMTTALFPRFPDRLPVGWPKPSRIEEFKLVPSSTETARLVFQGQAPSVPDHPGRDRPAQVSDGQRPDGLLAGRIPGKNPKAPPTLFPAIPSYGRPRRPSMASQADLRKYFEDPANKQVDPIPARRERVRGQREPQARDLAGIAP